MDFTQWDTRLAAYAVITNTHDQILLTWYNGSRPHPRWTLPGGGVNFEESLEDAVVREVFEETGYEVTVERPLFTLYTTDSEGPNPPRPYKSVRIAFEAKVIGGSLGTTEVGGTTDEARWISLATLLDQGPRAEIVDTAHSFIRREA